MFLKIFKYEFNNKNIKRILALCIILFFTIFLTFKSEFFYNVINYFPKYLDYYFENYLHSDISKMLVDDYIKIYMDYDLVNILSAQYLYVFSLGTTLFLLITIIMTIFIFHLIDNTIHNDIYNNFCIPKITRIGNKKYINRTILTKILISGLIMVLPKVFYLVILSLFFPNGSSEMYYINEMLGFDEAFLYNIYNFNSFGMILFDFLMSFFYGIIIANISMIISSLSNNKPLKYVIYIFTVAIISIFMIFIKMPPFIYYNSIFLYFSYYLEGYQTLFVFTPIIISIIFVIITYIINRYSFKKVVLKNI